MALKALPETAFSDLQGALGMTFAEGAVIHAPTKKDGSWHGRIRDRDGTDVDFTGFANRDAAFVWLCEVAGVTSDRIETS